MVNYTWLMLILSWRFQMSFPPYIGLFLTRMWLFAESDLAPLLPLRRRPLHFSSAYNNANKECIAMTDCRRGFCIYQILSVLVLHHMWGMIEHIYSLAAFTSQVMWCDSFIFILPVVRPVLFWSHLSPNNVSLSTTKQN